MFGSSGSAVLGFYCGGSDIGSGSTVAIVVFIAVVVVVAWTIIIYCGISIIFLHAVAETETVTETVNLPLHHPLCCFDRGPDASLTENANGNDILDHAQFQRGS